MTHWLGIEGQTAVVTGAAGGIGKGIAAALAEAGAITWVLDRDQAQAAPRSGTSPGLTLGVGLLAEVLSNPGCLVELPQPHEGVDELGTRREVGVAGAETAEELVEPSQLQHRGTHVTLDDLTPCEVHQPTPGGALQTLHRGSGSYGGPRLGGEGIGESGQALGPGRKQGECLP